MSDAIDAIEAPRAMSISRTELAFALFIGVSPLVCCLLIANWTYSASPTLSDLADDLLLVVMLGVGASVYCQIVTLAALIFRRGLKTVILVNATCFLFSMSSLVRVLRDSLTEHGRDCTDSYRQQQPSHH